MKMDVRPKRNTAYKVWIQDVHSAEERIDESSGLPYLAIRDLHAVRVHLFGSVINSAVQEGYGSMLLDDGSANIRLKVWGDDLYLVEDKQVGDLVFVIGRYANFSGERYIRPEIVRRISMDWALLRRVELTKMFGVPSQEEKITVKEPDTKPEETVRSTLSAREIILNEIEKNDEVDEETLFRVCNVPKEEVQTALQDLLKEGEIFCPKKEFYQLV